MTRTARLVVVCLSIAALAACGGDGDSDASGSPSTAGDATSSSAVPAAPAGAVVEVKATEKLQFDPVRLDAKVGQEFRGRLVQVGSIPHNIEIEDLGVKGSDTMTTKDGETKDFTFTADKAGEYKYVCTIHPGAMTGTVHVA